MIALNTLRLWTLAHDKREFERMKTLFDGSLQSVLDDEKVSAALREKSVMGLSEQSVVIALHDPCDIRKQYSEKLENLGIVRDLDGRFVNGYGTFNTVCVDEEGKQLHLSDITVYSNGDTHYVKQAELDEIVKKEVKGIKEGRMVEWSEREEAILQMLREEEAVNIGMVTRKQLRAVSVQFKTANPSIKVEHVLDRQFDDASLFEFIGEELDDLFTIRLKISRNSNEMVAVEGKKRAIKLKDADLIGKRVDILDKVRLKNKVYQQAKRTVEWGNLTLDGYTYTVVRVTLLKRDGTPIFKQPMLLLTNRTVTTDQDAFAVYRVYLMRSKIESVFKFVKQSVGWEQFQVRDWESIKNLIAFAFFIGGYFYEIEPQLAHHPVIAWLCQLGNGKGKVTRHYFLAGLSALLTHQHVELLKQQAEHTSPEWSDILEFIS